MCHLRGRLSDKAQQNALSGHGSSISTDISCAGEALHTSTEHCRDISWWKRLLCSQQLPGNLQCSITEETSRCCWAWTGYERNSAPLPTPFVSRLFSQLQPRPICEEVPDSSQNLPTWPLSKGISIKPPGPGPDGKKYSATLANKSTYTLKPCCFLVKFSVVYWQVSTKSKSSPLGIGVNTSLSTANCYSAFMSLADITTGKHSQGIDSPSCSKAAPEAKHSLAEHKTCCSQASLKTFKWKLHLLHD